MNAPCPAPAAVRAARPVTRRPASCDPNRGRARGFALVITLLIVSLLAVIAVSYLTSMSNERQTADAYASKTRAEQAAQAGADAAMAMLTQSFRDFPDSATVWDPNQSANTGSPAATTVDSPNRKNEGTSLYLRAVAQPQPVSINGKTATVANPFPSGAALPANDPTGNNPNNPACKTFVLPLISGVPGGYAQLASEALGTSSANPSLLPAFDLSEMDPARQTDSTKQYCTDLNVRRFGKKNATDPGDLQGVIGSPADWAPPSSTSKPLGPKPARALWVNVKEADPSKVNGTTDTRRVTGRYAFWIEDESFRANISSLSTLTSSGVVNRVYGQTDRPDNTEQPKNNGTARALTLGDMSLPGFLNALNTNTSPPIFPFPNDDAGTFLTTRVAYPGGVFPEPLAFVHAVGSDGSPALTTTTAKIDALRYSSTTQSGTLNFTRHGTQRLNLNGLYKTPSDPTKPQAQKDIQSAVDQIVQTLTFHLPNFGQRFYRNSASATDSASLNAKQVVTTSGLDLANIYLYKVAANICDYIDTDNQPTVIMSGGTVANPTEPTTPQEAPDAGPQPSTFWAQGKEATPFIQEVAVRYQPIVNTASNPPKGRFSLTVNYYIEFWNMTNKDINASTNLNNAHLWIRDQQQWTAFRTGNLLQADATTQTGPGYQTLQNDTAINDWEVDLKGVIFPAGAVTIVTTDPGYSTYVYKEISGATNTPATTIPHFANVSPCPLIAPNGQQVYRGKVTTVGGNVSVDGGLMLGSEFKNSVYPGTEVSMTNSYGYLDLVRGAITKTGGPGSNIYTNTDKLTTVYTNFSYGSESMGNNGTDGGQTATPSEMGDPRTNNEQLYINISDLGADGSHFMYGTRTLGSPNGATVKPELAGTQGWPDYYAMPATYTAPDLKTAPMVIADAPLTSIGQLGDIFDPARIPGPGGILYSRGGGRTFKVGQQDDRYSVDPSGNAAPNNTVDNIPASNGWAAWRLADVFSIDNDQEKPGRININGVRRDNGAALAATLDGWAFQPPTTTDPSIHGDKNSGLASTPLDSNAVTQLINAIKYRLDTSQAGMTTKASGAMFDRGEFGELIAAPNYPTAPTTPVPLFGSNSAGSSTSYVSGVNMSKATDRGREETFRRLSELICTRGDTFTVYTVGQSIFQAPIANPANPPPMKVTGTHRMRVTFRLVPKDASGNSFNPLAANSAPTNPTLAASRFAKADHYEAQVLEINTF